MSNVTNTLLREGDSAWLQATLPVKLGSLGVCRAVEVAPSAYLASVAATSDLVSAILPTNHCSLAVPYTDAALTQWSQGNQFTPPLGPDASR